MPDLATLRTLFQYSDWSNQTLLAAAAALTDEVLDSRIDVGRGTLRRTFIHILAGETVWLSRSKGKAETPWPNEMETVSVAELIKRFETNQRERDAFLTTLKDADLARVQPYRDSKGSLFRAALGDMLLQTFLHSKHHHAQAVNILRRLVGATAPELDYMMHIRQGAE